MHDILRVSAGRYSVDLAQILNLLVDAGEGLQLALG